MGEAHGKYAPAGPVPLGLTPPTRPQPRAAVLVSLPHDPEAAAVRRRLEARGWQVAQCDAALGPLAAKTNPPAGSARARIRGQLSTSAATSAKRRADRRAATPAKPLRSAARALKTRCFGGLRDLRRAQLRSRCRAASRAGCCAFAAPRASGCVEQARRHPLTPALEAAAREGQTPLLLGPGFSFTIDESATNQSINPAQGQYICN